MQGQFAPLAAAHEPVTLTRKQTSQASVGQNRHRRDAARQDDGRGGIGERATIATSVGLPSGSSCCASLRITLFTPRLAPAARPASKPSPSAFRARSEEHTSELQSLMRISYAVFCLKKNNATYHKITQHVKLSLKS